MRTNWSTAISLNFLTRLFCNLSAVTKILSVEKSLLKKKQNNKKKTKKQTRKKQLANQIYLEFKRRTKGKRVLLFSNRLRIGWWRNRAGFIQYEHIFSSFFYCCFVQKYKYNWVSVFSFMKSPKQTIKKLQQKQFVFKPTFGWFLFDYLFIP